LIEEIVHIIPLSFPSSFSSFNFPLLRLFSFPFPFILAPFPFLLSITQPNGIVENLCRFPFFGLARMNYAVSLQFEDKTSRTQGRNVKRMERMKESEGMKGKKKGTNSCKTVFCSEKQKQKLTN